MSFDSISKILKNVDAEASVIKEAKAIGISFGDD